MGKAKKKKRKCQCGLDRKHSNIVLTSEYDEESEGKGVKGIGKEVMIIFG